MFLTRSAPEDVFPGCLMVYDVVDESVIARSGVLQCIVDAGGDTRLPANVSLSEFNVWRCASPERKSVAQQTDICSIFTVIKVGSLHCLLSFLELGRCL